MRHKLMACLAVAALSSPAFPQAPAGSWGPQSGDWEFSLGGGGTNDNDFEDGAFNLDGDIGYYLTDEFEIAMRQSVSYDNVGDDTDWRNSSRAALDYHFPMFDNRLRPFVGVNFGYIYGDDVSETFAAGPEGGVKWYVKDDAFLFGRAEYQFFFDDADEAEDNFDDGLWIYTVGIGLNF